jgi:peptidoglycan/LPS O-acetylase OafA/YrhL
MERSGTERLLGIDALRAIGALMVLVQHGFWLHLFEPLWKTPYFWLFYPSMQGHVGVALFLVVSGFCIHARAARSDPNANPEFLPFWKRRLRRLYPPYLAALVLSAVGIVVMSAYAVSEAGQPVVLDTVWRRTAPDGGTELAWGGLVSLLLLTPFWPRALEVYGNYPFWSLALEEQLYLAYFFVPALRRRIGIEGTLAVALAVSLVWRALAIFGPLGHCAPMMSAVPVRVVGMNGPESAIAFLNMAPSRWFEWTLGALAVELAFRRTPRRAWYESVPLAAAAAIAALGCQWSHLGWVFTDALWGIACFIVVNRVVRADQEGTLHRLRGIGALAGVGLFSYSLYLIHEPLLHMIGHPLVQVMPWPIARVLAMIVAVPLAWLFYRALEVPAMNWSRKSRHAAPVSGKAVTGGNVR